MCVADRKTWRWLEETCAVGGLLIGLWGLALDVLGSAGVGALLILVGVAFNELTEPDGGGWLEGIAKAAVLFVITIGCGDWLGQLAGQPRGGYYALFGLWSSWVSLVFVARAPDV